MKKAIWLYLAITILAASLISCSSNDLASPAQTGISNSEYAANMQYSSFDILKEDMEFIKKIENIPSAGYAEWEHFESLDEFIGQRTNLIIRGQVISRGESAITAFGMPLYPTEDLRSENYEYARNARRRIATPYKIHINEVYHGDINKEGDIITLYALYGILEGFENRIFSEEPIYNVGAEYIMFLRVEEEYGNIVYISSMSLLKLDQSGKTFESEGLFGNIYSKYENNTDKFVADLKQLIKANNYSTKIDVYGSKAEFQEIIDRMNRKRAEDGFDAFIPNVLDK